MKQSIGVKVGRAWWLNPITITFSAPLEYLAPLELLPLIIFSPSRFLAYFNLYNVQCTLSFLKTGYKLTESRQY